MFLAVANRSRTFSSLPCSADEQMCRSWEGAQPGRQPKLDNGNIPYHGCHALVIKWGGPGGKELSASSVFFLAWGLAANWSSGGERKDCIL